jgi:hypothetical protein
MSKHGKPRNTRHGSHAVQPAAKTVVKQAQVKANAKIIGTKTAGNGPRKQ